MAGTCAGVRTDRRAPAALAACVGLLLAVLLPVGAVHADDGQLFDDVGPAHPFVVEIGWLVDQGITTGFADGTFRPALSVSRQAIAAFLYRLAGEPAVTGSAGFADVGAGHPFHDAITWLVNEGITTGFGDNTFRPALPVSRQAIAAFLHRYSGQPAVTGTAGFSDVGAGHPFHDEITWLVNQGITTGFGDNTFRPTNPVTRQAIAAFLFRMAGPTFVTTWNTNLIGGTTITLPFHGDVDVDIDWGDGTTDTGVTGPASHTYATNGTYTVNVEGTFTGYGQEQNPTYGALLAVNRWGADAATTNLTNAFAFATNLTSVAQPPPTVTTMSGMFRQAAAFNQPIGNWNTSNVTNMNGMFLSATAFNQPIGTWDTSNVTDMNGMFRQATAFNRPLGSWDTSSVTDMGYMFAETGAFNQPIGTWDTSSVSEMWFMFDRAAAFNQPISNWNTGNVTRMINMFRETGAFNQPIGSWDTSNVTRMDSMFQQAAAFNQPIGSWNTSNVTHMSGMFWETAAFDQDISTWNTANVTSMLSMFRDAAAFNRDLSGWCVSQIATQPDNFDTGATSWTEPRPVWGTCP